MKSWAKRVAVIFAAFGLLLTGCVPAHTHTFDIQSTDEQYLKLAATCQSPALFYYSCECGVAGEETFTKGAKTAHKFTEEVAEEKYLKTAATCQSGAVYYKSCSVCGKAGNYLHTFATEELGDHAYTEEVPDFTYVKEEATMQSSAVFYKTCVCGLVGEDTFTWGNPLREYTAEEKTAYMPTSLTLSLYEPENSIYGFTYNTQERPLRPVLQYSKGETLTDDCEEVAASVKSATSYTKEMVEFTYYIVKLEVELDPSTTYTYRVYDKYVDIGTETVTMETKDPKATAFSFAHVSDSQVDPTAYADSGAYFNATLAQIVGKNDFIVHSGDVVQHSKYEYEWEQMLNRNFQYLSKIPVMAISGNHENEYNPHGYSETFKHFHNKIPTQDSTVQGYFYSFTYGNAKFIMLNTNKAGVTKLETEQYNWLVEELKNNTATWTIVVMHNPMYSIGKYGSDPSRNSICLALRAQLGGLFAQYGVDLVLQGHDHTISRTYPMNASNQPTSETFKEEGGVAYSVDPAGVIYLMNGPAGNQARVAHDGTYDQSIYKYGRASVASSWAQISINGNRLTVSVQYVSGGQATPYMDTWGIEKTETAAA